jgi:anaerobic selenocysteine-containing dehydrogenase
MTAWTADNSDPNRPVPNKDQYIDGLMCWGQNPAVGGPSCDFERKAMENLKWMMCADLWETETSIFWKRPGVDPTTIGTEVILLPAAASYEKEGSIVNSGRWSQWRYKALDPPGHALDDLEIINRLAKELISLYQADIPVPAPNTGANLVDPVAKLHWGPYPGVDAHGANGSSPTGYETGGHADPHKVGWEINGYFCPTSTTGTPGYRVDGFWGSNAALTTLQEDGKTSSGNWLYCSHYVNPGDPINSFDASATTPNGNRQENRDPVEKTRTGNYIGLYQNWSICWPLNRRIIYNGASVYQTGHPNVGRPLAPQKWVLDFGPGGTGATGPTTNGSDVADGFTAPGGSGARYPFIMQREGVGHIFGPGREDGPMPEHYEPMETPLTSNVISQTLTSPTLFAHARPERFEVDVPGTPSTIAEFPIVGTTYRLTEHWQAGQMTRNNPWLCQVQPNTFVELSEELAAILGISNGDTVEVKTQRTELYGNRYKAVACVTKRFKPYTIDGSTVHHIGTIWHFGYSGLCTGDSGNLLTAHIGDANTGIQESKGFLCNIRKYPGGAFL